MTTHFVQGLKDEVSENTLKKRREYYLKHGVKNVFPCGLLESSSLDITTPYMLRNDGELLKCGDYHPYIKSYKEETLEETIKYLKNHNSFLKWFYENTLNEEVKNIISNLKFTQEEIDRLWYLTNQEFCRVRTSNYRYKTGGDNGEIYFRISSENFNWFELIWNVCVKFIHNIDYVTIMKDPQTFEKQFDYIKIKDIKINKLPIKDFIELDGEPLVESQVIKEPSFENNYHYGRVWATNSTSEIKSAILSSAISLRILYDRKQKLYIYGAAEDYIHRELLDIAWEFGLYPQYKARWQVTEGHFEDYTTQLIFAPTDLVNETAGASIGEDGYTDRIVYDFGVITGRDENRDECLSSIPLIKSLKNKQIRHEVFDGWENDGYTHRIKVLSDNTKSVSDNLTEDTIKLKNGKWANVGKDGKRDSGTFKTKKKADAQRKAMFANGYKESIENKQEITEAKYLMPYDKNKIIKWMQNHFKVSDLPVKPIKGPQLIDLNGDFVQIHSFHGNILQELRKDGLITLDNDSRLPEWNYVFSDLFEEIGYIRCNGGIGGDGYSYLSLPSKNKPTDKQIEALLLWLAYFPIDKAFDICRAEGRCIWTSEIDEKTVLHNIDELYKLSEDLKDEVSENISPIGLGESLDTNNIISLLSNTFGTTDEPQPTAMYVLPNGKFLFTTPLEPSDDCDYEIDEHRNIDDFLYHKNIIENDRYLEDDGSLFTENVLNCIRFNITDESYGNYSYIQLNKKQPTSQQYDSLLKIFDYVINNEYKYISIIFDSQYGKQVKLELNDYSSDELLKKIKRFYISGILTEGKKPRNIVFETIVHSKAMEELELTFNNNPDALKFLNVSRLKLENAGINFYKLSIVEDEGKYKIPNTNKKIHFYALKNTSLQIRCYFFLIDDTFYIGRIVKKDYQKLDKKDLEKAYWRFDKDNVK